MTTHALRAEISTRNDEFCVDPAFVAFCSRAMEQLPHSYEDEEEDGESGDKGA